MLEIEWLPGPVVVGDFTWPGLGSDIVVSDRVARALRSSKLDGFELNRLEFASPPRGRRSLFKQIVDGLKGAALWDLWPTRWVACDVSRSTLNPNVSGRDTLGPIFGVERFESSWDHASRELHWIRHAREPGAGLYVVEVADIFRVNEVPGWVFCSDRFKALVELHSFVNVEFLEVGEVVAS